MSKPFFYRVNAADFFSIIRGLSNKELVIWTRNFASDLVAGNSTDPFTSAIIEEAHKYKEKKAEAGKKGMQSRYSKP